MFSRHCDRGMDRAQSTYVQPSNETEGEKNPTRISYICDSANLRKDQKKKKLNLRYNRAFVSYIILYVSRYSRRR